jgi:hypothetical protein
MGLQAQHDLEAAADDLAGQLRKIKPAPRAVA